MNLNEDKLLSNSETREFLPPIEDRPKLSAKEFLKFTPKHELDKLFGVDAEIQSSTQNALQKLSESLSIKRNRETEKQNEVADKIKKWSWGHSILILFMEILLALVLFILVLYVWGGIVLAN